jgi:type I site-specific restriction endonuclease
LFNKVVSDDEVLRLAQQYHLSPKQARSDCAKKFTSYSNSGFPKPLIDRFNFDVLPVNATSADMLGTGYDQNDIENLVMLQPTRSAIKYAQMRGHGNCPCELKRRMLSVRRNSPRSENSMR